MRPIAAAALRSVQGTPNISISFFVSFFARMYVSSPEHISVRVCVSDWVACTCESLNLLWIFGLFTVHNVKFGWRFAYTLGVCGHAVSVSWTLGIGAFNTKIIHVVEFKIPCVELCSKRILVNGKRGWRSSTRARGRFNTVVRILDTSVLRYRLACFSPVPFAQMKCTFCAPLFTVMPDERVDDGDKSTPKNI